jgi:hypothetical protein
MTISKERAEELAFFVRLPSTRDELTAHFRQMIRRSSKRAVVEPPNQDVRIPAPPQSEEEEAYVREREHQLALARIADMKPDAERGRKVLAAASQGGREVSRQLQATRRAILAEVDAYVRAHGPRPDRAGVSLTEARERIAQKHGISRKSIERWSRRK